MSWIGVEAQAVKCSKTSECEAKHFCDERNFGGYHLENVCEDGQCKCDIINS